LLELLFRAHGNKLLTVKLFADYLSNLLLMITRYCPSVQELWIELLPRRFSVQLPSALALRRICLASDFTHIGIFEETMLNILTMRRPALECIQLAGIQSDEISSLRIVRENRAEWRKWVEMWARENVRFVTDDGVVIPP
jgi:hypothetical protein